MDDDDNASIAMDARFDWLRKRLERLEQYDSLRRLTVRQPVAGRMLTDCDGKRLINFGSNDYLGFAAESPLHLRDVERSGSGASALVCGFSSEAQTLQDQLADFESTQGAVLFPTGFAANLGVIATLAEAGDLILSDAANHASIIDGCRLSKAQRFIYPHADTSAVKALLDAHRRRFTRAFIITDSVFSMDGDFAPLGELCDLAERYDAILIADEAHATGVYGEHGGGLCEHLGVKHRVPIRVGTLSKALGSIGGFVAAPRIVCDYLVNAARSMIYSTALPPVAIHAAMTNLKRIEDEPQRRDRLLALSDRFRDQVSSAWRIPSASATGQIIPFVIGDNRRTLDLAFRLREEGFFVPAIRPPTVPEGSARLRVSLSAAHRDDEVDQLAAALCRQKL
ncbi:MAG: 8-amino-7-oxononanoate synthase [Pirellulaceae bacterium]